MKVRFYVEKDCTLRSKDGRVLGKLDSVVLEIDEPPSTGGLGGAVEAGQQQLGPSEAGNPEGTDHSGRARGGGFDPAQEVWNRYVQRMKPRNSGLDAETRKIITAALKVATIDECKRAIDGCASSAFHMGENDRGRKYNQITQILKGKRGGQTTRERIDFFIEIAENAHTGARLTSGGDARVSQAKRDVLDAHEFPNDENVQERGNEAKSWLESQGWRIEQSQTGSPEFHPPESS